MTREEKILNKSIDYSEIEENFLEYDDCGDVCDDKGFVEKAFIEGAKWADETMIDKAVAWFKDNWREYIFHDADGMIGFIGWEKDFRKAMKGNVE